MTALLGVTLALAGGWLLGVCMTKVKVMNAVNQTPGHEGTLEPTRALDVTMSAGVLLVVGALICAALQVGVLS